MVEKACCSEVSPVVFSLVIAFGASSWLSVNGAWLELPILVNQLPEGWNLPSYMSVVVQLACIGPLIFGILQHIYGFRLPIVSIIIGFLIFGCIAQVLMAIFWDQTSMFNSIEHSTALFILFFSLSLVNTTSNVTFLPFMMRFKPQYITAYFIGMGFSALLPSLTAIVQGAGRIECKFNANSTDNFTAVDIPPRFGVTAFNVILTIFMAVSLISFCCLNWLSVGKKALVTSKQSPETETPSQSSSLLEERDRKQQENDAEKCEEIPFLSNVSYILLLGLTAYVCALMNGALL